jgi:hypothetical protein
MLLWFNVSNDSKVLSPETSTISQTVHLWTKKNELDHMFISNA